MNTAKAKKTTVKQYRAGIQNLKYGIEPTSRIAFKHLLSLCLYTDHTDLCTAFSQSLRPLNNYESIKSLKQRNRDFYFMSKYLRECVELFGDYDSFWSTNRLKGPFYCGLSFVATFHYTDITLYPPTSTSTEKMVAIRFSGDGDGIIVEFDNHDKELHGFDCSWFSNFKEESEVLFMGGANEIRIVGVTIMDTKITYQVYFRALGKFNDSINGQESEQWTNSETRIICDLIDIKVYNKYNPKIDRYIQDSFALFTNNKLEITLNLSWLTLSESKATNIIMHEFLIRHQQIYFVMIFSNYLIIYNLFVLIIGILIINFHSHIYYHYYPNHIHYKELPLMWTMIG